VEAEPDFVETEEVADDDLDMKKTQHRAIVQALKKHNYRRSAAAKELGISERTLYRKIKESGIHENDD
jgi:transcriptional regulator with PAS, ATPase and Fis domain